MVTDDQGTAPAGGWFPDPAGSPYLRWWDGAVWTDHFIDATTGEPPRELPVEAPSALQQETAEQQEQPSPADALEPASAGVATPVHDHRAADEPLTVDSSPVETARDQPLFPSDAVETESAPNGATLSVPAAEASDEVTPTFLEPHAPAVPAMSSAPANDAPLTRRQLRQQEERESLANFSPTASPATPIDHEHEPAVEQPPVSVEPTPAVPNPAAVGFEPTGAEPTVAASIPLPFGFEPTPAVPHGPADSVDPFGGTLPPQAMPATPSDSEPSFPFEVADQGGEREQPLFRAVPSRAAAVQPTSEVGVTTWPFASTFETAPTANSLLSPAASAQAEAPFAPNSATPTSWLSAPAPQQSDASSLLGAATDTGVADASAATLTRGRQRSSDERLNDRRPESGDDSLDSSTWAIWIFAALPLVQFALIYLVYVATKQTNDTYRFVVLLGPIVIYLALAAVDRSLLVRAGHRSVPSPLLAIIPPLYLAFRATRVGPKSLPQLITWFVLQIAVVVVLVAVFPAQFSQLTTGTTAASTSAVVKPAPSTSITAAQRAKELTPTGMQEALKKQFLSQGITLSSVTCPALANTTDATQVTCKGVMTGGSLDIVVAVDSTLKSSAFDIVSSTPPTK